MVNQRRALGQNVSLADMFSAVGISHDVQQRSCCIRMRLGLQAIAQEWFTRIQAITITTNQVTSTLIHGGDVWKYSDTGQDLGTNWSQPNYDDSGWASGAARLGYGDPAVFTTVSFGPNADQPVHHNLFPRLVCRAWQRDLHQSQFPPRAGGRRRGLAQRPGSFPHQHAGRTDHLHEPGVASDGSDRGTPYTFYPTNIAVSNLPAGTNLVAVEVHLFVPTRIALGFDMELIGTGCFLPPSLSIASAGTNIFLAWPVAGGTGYTLYSSTNLTAPGSWTIAAATVQTNGGQYVVTLSPDVVTRFFRLQKP